MKALLEACVTEMKVRGAVKSTVHSARAIALTLPARSVARAWKACGPSATPDRTTGLWQALKPASSKLHSKAAISLAEKLSVLVVCRDFAPPWSSPESEIAGAVRSIVKACEIGWLT